MKRTAVALACGLGSACFAWPATVDLAYRPVFGQPLDAAGIHRLGFCVEVRDARAIGDPRNVGQRAGSPLHSPAVRSTRDAADVVADAVREELRSHDLRVSALGPCDVRVAVELTDLYALASGDGLGGEVEGHVAGQLRVFARHTAATPYLDLPVRGRAEVRSRLLTARKYEWALNAALAEFARRAVRHPDFLIAVQRVTPSEP